MWLELGSASGAALALIAVAAASVRARLRQVERDRALVASVDACFAEIARRRGLVVETAAPLRHPVLGEVPIPSRVHGTIDGFRVSLAVERDDGGEGDERTVLRIASRPDGAAWPLAGRACRSGDALASGVARAALARLCGSSRRVSLVAEGLVASPDVARAPDGVGGGRFVERDVDRLDVWLASAIDLARALSDA